MELQTLEIRNKFTKELDNCDIGGQVFCAMQVLDEVWAVDDKIVDTILTGEKENTDAVFVGEVEDKERDKITLTSLIYDDKDQEAVPLALKKPKW
eukprot:2068544-Ditylum_brightwellii.AAC.1